MDPSRVCGWVALLGQPGNPAERFGEAIGYVIVGVLVVLLIWKLAGGGRRKKKGPPGPGPEGGGR